MVDHVSPLRELSRARCLDLLATAGLGRVGVSVQALPVILPVRYAVIGETVVFRTAPGTKLTAAMRRSVVAFEADRWDPCGAWGWSVLVQGVASEVTDPPLQAAARGLLANDLPFLDGEVARVVAVEPAFLSGRAFGAIPEDPAWSLRR
ncbi:MAG: pyridoxamine 5'-phosphate oxidase family protein [Candidatus Dormiibacterota bacterium]|jgi:nitroimidazol reductase NimA-like FMN-containing flavoprotein (pyridoxamine 5'-phosphate oxidase superfamily)